MLYLNGEDIDLPKKNWGKLIKQIEKGVKAIASNNYSQPLKLYLRYGSLRNRIIAMPAFVGFDQNISGLKWIASFPNNLSKNLPRAHSITVLNDADTGIPKAIINTAEISAIRTAAVSGFVINRYLRSNKNINHVVGIIGLGPIGKKHFDMCQNILNKKTTYYVFDSNDAVHKNFGTSDNIKKVSSVEEIFCNCNIIITATNTLEPFISSKPLTNSLILNVSLRDFVPDYHEYVKNGIIVDDWDEVNREGTTIEAFSSLKGLTKADTINMAELLRDEFIFDKNITYMFCPMGMAVFDIVIANLYYNEAIKSGLGQLLRD